MNENQLLILLAVSIMSGICNVVLINRKDTLKYRIISGVVTGIITGIVYFLYIKLFV